VNIRVLGRGAIATSVRAFAPAAGYLVDDPGPAEALVVARGTPPRAEDSPFGAMLESHVQPVLEGLQTSLVPNALVVLFSSIAARKGSRDPAYAATMGAIPALMESLAIRYPQYRFVTLSSGLIADSFTERAMPRDVVAKHCERMRNGQLVRASHIARLILALIEIPSIHNTVIAIDGGYR